MQKKQNDYAREKRKPAGNEPGDELPRQKALTDEEEPPKETPRWRRAAKRALAAAGVILALCLAYVFLLLGEPDEDVAALSQKETDPVTMPMTAVESPGETSVEGLAELFGRPVLCLYGSALSMQRSRVYDTAFQGEYARRVTLTYAFDDGETLTVESVRPIAAAALWKEEGYRLDGETLYYIGGMDAALMANDRQICVFGQTDSAAYAVRCPVQRREELETLLKQTALISAGE